MTWPLSQDQLRALKKVVIPHISFCQIIRRYSRSVEEVYSASFTHKCICPNPKHKNGQERTPSFYFSDQEGTFICYGCSWTGDLFDVISLMEGMPWHTAVRIALKKYEIDPNNVDFESVEGRGENYYQYVSNVDLELSSLMREYLAEFKDTDKYSEEKEWVDRMFQKIDERFATLTSEDREAARAFHAQVLIELERRKKE